MTPPGRATTLRWQTHSTDNKKTCKRLPLRPDVRRRGRRAAAAHLTRLRVEAACRHLERDHTSVTDVAYLCGFSSSAHLAAALRRHTGLTPSQYRRRHRAR
ncbi:helix-turn-helix domain-containing protein [Actinoplanes sp. NPDC004185]